MALTGADLLAKVRQPGDGFEIRLGRKQIRLVPVGGADEGE